MDGERAPVTDMEHPELGEQMVLDWSGQERRRVQEVVLGSVEEVKNVKWEHSGMLTHSA